MEPMNGCNAMKLFNEPNVSGFSSNYGLGFELEEGKLLVEVAAELSEIDAFGTLAGGGSVSNELYWSISASDMSGNEFRSYFKRLLK